MLIFGDDNRYSQVIIYLYRRWKRSFVHFAALIRSCLSGGSSEMDVKVDCFSPRGSSGWIAVCLSDPSINHQYLPGFFIKILIWMNRNFATAYCWALFFCTRASLVLKLCRTCLPLLGCWCVSWQWPCPTAAGPICLFEQSGRLLPIHNLAAICWRASKVVTIAVAQLLRATRPPTCLWLHISL